VQSESNGRIKAIWERFLEYELGQLRYVSDLFEQLERRDAAEVLQDGKLPAPIEYVSHRDFVRETLRNEVHLSAKGTQFIQRDEESPETRDYRAHLNSEGVASDRVANGYVWAPGTEIKVKKPQIAMSEMASSSARAH
jgi:hypothetical protein